MNYNTISPTEAAINKYLQELLLIKQPKDYLASVDDLDSDNDFGSSYAMEPEAVYGASLHSYNTNLFLFNDFINNKMNVVQVIQKGVPFCLFSLIQKFSMLSDVDWADIFDISIKSIQRYRLDNHIFRPNHSEKILEIAEVFHWGKSVFGSVEQFNKWLLVPCLALGGAAPKQFLRDSYGKELLVSELQRIHYGILA